MRGLLLIAIFGACGDNAAIVVDASVPLPDAHTPCTATFSGNFDESATLDTCAAIVPGAAVVGHAALALTIPTITLATSVAVKIDLGAPVPLLGPYSSDSVTTWQARAVEHVGTGVCTYSAGDNVVPQGSFALTIESIDGAGDVHGSAEVVQYVLGSPLTDCGTADTETIDVRF